MIYVVTITIRRKDRLVGVRLRNAFDELEKAAECVAEHTGKPIEDVIAMTKAATKEIQVRTYDTNSESEKIWSIHKLDLE